MKTIIYTTKFCSYCDMAKSLLKKREIDYQTIDVTDSPEKRKMLIQRSGGLKTVPQIFIDGRHIGGFDALQKIDREGELEELIQASKKSINQINEK